MLFNCFIIIYIYTKISIQKSISWSTSDLIVRDVALIPFSSRKAIISFALTGCSSSLFPQIYCKTNNILFFLLKNLSLLKNSLLLSYYTINTLELQPNCAIDFETYFIYFFKYSLSILKLLEHKNRTALRRFYFKTLLSFYGVF